ncbi:hypothetical protein AABF57_002871, partial [Listeria monocytogenes]
NEKTFNFDEYQKTYRGQMWVLMKNGIVDVEATNAYNAAVLNGELPHKSNEAQEEAELLQAVIQSVKEGIDPVTGQEISKAQGFGIISGLVFRYTAGGYKGKKFKVSKDWLRRRKKNNGVEVGTDFGKIGKLVNHPNIKINWSEHSEHGMSRLKQRGLSKSQVDDFVERGKALSQNGGEKFAFITENGVAIVSKDGKLVTAWGKKDFDEGMEKIIEKLYGK